MQPDYRILADANDLCGEGPVWEPRLQALYWTDIVGRRFSRYSWVEAKY
jgi:sugar lactone lactonase YvrE